MHRKMGTAAGLTGIFGGLIFAAACGGSNASVGDGSDSGSSGDVSNGSGRDSGPSISSDGGDDSGTSVNVGGRSFAARTLFLGDSDRSGVQSDTAWENFGANIDGKISTPSSTDLCTVAAGGSKATVYQDGTDGIDNSFGENILPIILSVFGSDFSTKFNAGIEAGASTFMLDLTGLTDDASQTASPVTAQLFSGVSIGTPTWTTSGEWGAYKSSLVGGSLSSGAVTKFTTSSISGGVWTSGTNGDFPFNISLGSATLALVIHHTIISFSHSSANSATLGNVAGVLTTAEFLAEFRKVAGNISTQLCDGAALDDITTQMQAASDILKDGTNTSGVACDGISIGIGFNATEVAPPDVALADPTAVDVCE